MNIILPSVNVIMCLNTLPLYIFDLFWNFLVKSRNQCMDLAGCQECLQVLMAGLLHTYI